MDWFSDFQIRVNCTFTQNCLCMKPKREQHKNECFCSPFISADQWFVRKELQVCYLRSETVEESKVWRIHCKPLHAWTSANSGGSGVLGYLFSKCCLKVLGSGICVLQTAQVYTRAPLAAAFWSCPCFFCPACFLAFFCWDWIFWGQEPYLPALASSPPSPAHVPVPLPVEPSVLLYNHIFP